MADDAALRSKLWNTFPPGADLLEVRQLSLSWQEVRRLLDVLYAAKEPPCTS